MNFVIVPDLILQNGPAYRASFDVPFEINVAPCDGKPAFQNNFLTLVAIFDLFILASKYLVYSFFVKFESFFKLIFYEEHISLL